MKANYRVIVYSEFTKRDRTIKLYQMDLEDLADWLRTFNQTKGLIIRRIINNDI